MIQEKKLHKVVDRLTSTNTKVENTPNGIFRAKETLKERACLTAGSIFFRVLDFLEYKDVKKMRILCSETYSKFDTSKETELEIKDFWNSTLVRLTFDDFCVEKPENEFWRKYRVDFASYYKLHYRVQLITLGILKAFFAFIQNISEKFLVEIMGKIESLSMNPVGEEEEKVAKDILEYVTIKEEIFKNLNFLYVRSCSILPVCIPSSIKTLRSQINYENYPVIQNFPDLKSIILDSYCEEGEGYFTLLNLPELESIIINGSFYLQIMPNRERQYPKLRFLMQNGIVYLNK